MLCQEQSVPVFGQQLTDLSICVNRVRHNKSKDCPKAKSTITHHWLFSCVLQPICRIFFVPCWLVGCCCRCFSLAESTVFFSEMWMHCVHPWSAIYFIASTYNDAKPKLIADYFRSFNQIWLLFVCKFFPFDLIPYLIVSFARFKFFSLNCLNRL